MCHGKITWARSLSIKFVLALMPRETSPSISSKMLFGFSTTPPVTTHCTPLARMPLGMSESLYFSPATTTDQSTIAGKISDVGK